MEGGEAMSELRCSFCNRAFAEVRKMISGPNGVAICDGCVDACNDVIADAPVRPAASDEREPAEEPPILFPFKCPRCGHHWKTARTW
jgi:ATP-dependent Clp protease ATP-binding subunit ClpX